MRTVASRRGTEMHWERAELTLDEAQRAELAQLVIRHRLLELDAEYQEPGVMDGTHWLLRLQQAPRDHIVYCDNRFPPELRDFATELDDLLDGAGLPAAGFTRPPDREQGGHDRALWDALYASRGDAE